MATVNARFVELEDKVQEHSQALQLLGQDLGHLKMGVERLDQRFDRLDESVDRGFLWLVGLLVGVLATVITGFITVVSQLLSR